MHWTTQYTKKTRTKVAEPAPGYRYEIVARESAEGLKVYETTPSEKRHVIASLPLDNAAVLIAERAWEMQQRFANDAEGWSKIVDQRNNGPTTSYVVTVPENQSLTVQETLDCLYGTVLDIRMLQAEEPGMETTTVLHRPDVWKAVLAVNEDLKRRGLQPLMEELPLLGGPLRGEEALTLILFLQRHYRWTGDREEPVAIWPETGLSWTEIAEANRRLMARRNGSVKLGHARETE